MKNKIIISTILTLLAIFLCYSLFLIINQKEAENNSINIDKELCFEKGGKYEKKGMAQIYICNIPTTDSGKSCTSSKECEGLCLVKSGEGKCSPWTDYDGCNPIMEEGKEVTICID